MAPRLWAWVLIVAAGAPGCRRDLDLDRALLEAEALYHRGRLIAAHERTRQALDPDAPAPVDARGWRLRLLGAEVLAELGKASAARLVLERPLPAPIGGGDLEARREKILGQAAARTGDRAEAARRFETAGRLARAATTPALPIEITYRQAALLAELGRHDEAERKSRAVIDMATGAPEAKRWRAAAFINLGGLAVARERWAEALTFLEPALAEARALGAEALTARALGEAGLCHSRLGDFERARGLLEQAAEIQQRLGQEAALAETLGALGKTASLSGDLEQAAADFERALHRARPHSPGTAGRWASHLAASYRALERWEEAARANAEAQARWREAHYPDGLLAAALEAAAIARGRGDRAEAQRQYQDVLAQACPRKAIHWAAGAGLAGLAAERDSADAARSFSEALAHLEEARADLRGVDSRSTLLDQLRRLYTDQVEWLMRQGRSREALRVVERARAHLLAERLGRPGRPARIALATLRQRARQRDEVLVSFWVAPERSYAWVISAGGIRLVRLPPERELRRAVDGFLAFLEQRRVDARTLDRSPAQVLGDLVIRPLAVPPGSKVVIAADGPLQAVPFGALVVAGDEPRYWMEQVTIALTPSLAALDPGPELLRAPQSPNLLAIGAAEGELSVVRRHFPAAATTVLAGSLARPEAYLQSDPRRFSMVHLAAAALANPASALDSSIVLQRGAGGDRLSLRDLLRLSLGADLISISGRQGAVTSAQGSEALASFAGGLLAAGARHAVLGLWNGDGAATTQLLDRLYAEIARGADPASALRSAQLGLLRWPGGWQAPFHWAAFQIHLGPGSPREPPLRSSL